jgi:uncharacterized membrane protein YbaN (DUF454 family)
MVKGSVRLIFLILGFVTLALAIIGIPLPILPTTPFLLLSLFFFSRSSQKLHDWLYHSKFFGKYIQDWDKHGVIRTRAKVMAMTLIVALFSYTLIYVHVEGWIKVIVALTGVGVSTFILTRPGQPTS